MNYRAADYRPLLDWIDGQDDGMRASLIALADTNSGSLNLTGLDDVREQLQALFAPLGGAAETIELAPHEVIDDAGNRESQPLGRALRIRKRPSAPLRVFLGGHMDTVFGADHPFQQTVTVDADTINGPGVADLKGGLLVMIKALEALERSPWADAIGWEVLLNPDEEIGSPGSAKLLTEAAARNHIGLVYEPSLPDGNLAGARKGSGNFSAVVRGRAAHAGREHHLGRNAIRAMADFIGAIDELNQRREGVTINPGYVRGGGPVNIVPDLAICRFNVRIAEPDDEAWLLDEVHRVVTSVDARDGIDIELHGGFGRKPKILSPANQALFQMIGACGEELGLNLAWQPTGGCCDGNNLAAAGLPNVDTLGVVGGKIHSAHEYMRLSSLTERAKLSALLLMKLAAGELRLEDAGSAT